jgi:hypothetical protein
MSKLIDDLRNIATIIGLMLSSVSFILIGSDNNNQSVVNLGALTFLIFFILFVIGLVLMVLERP